MRAIEYVALIGHWVSVTRPLNSQERAAGNLAGPNVGAKGIVTEVEDIPPHLSPHARWGVYLGFDNKGSGIAIYEHEVAAFEFQIEMAETGDGDGDGDQLSRYLNELAAGPLILTEDQKRSLYEATAEGPVSVVSRTAGVMREYLRALAATEEGRRRYIRYGMAAVRAAGNVDADHPTVTAAIAAEPRRSLSPETRDLLRIKIEGELNDIDVWPPDADENFAAEAVLDAIEPILVSIDTNAHLRGSAEAHAGEPR